MNESAPLTESDILADAIAPDCGDMTVDAAHSVLTWKFSQKSLSHMRKLLERNNKGVLTPAEHDELDRYRRVGMFLDIVQAKARISLKHADTAS